MNRLSQVRLETKSISITRLKQDHRHIRGPIAIDVNLKPKAPRLRD